MPIEYDAPAHCVNCQTRYCSDRCLRYHAHRGGHDDECAEIANDGGAEQHHANKKYEEAVADAVEECAEDTVGQTCYICLDGDAEEGLVRGCSCRGGAGFAHVSCLAKQAKVLVAEAEERDLDLDAFNARWERWANCRLCEQRYHGVVRCALGWACWKTYVGRREADWARRLAMSLLGSGLYAAGHHEDALSVGEAELAMKRRLGVTEESILITQGNLAVTYSALRRDEEAMCLRRDVYAARLRLHGEEHRQTLIAANNFANSLIFLKRFGEAKSLLRKTMPAARRILGDSDEDTLRLRWTYARAFHEDPSATLDDLREAVTTLEDIDPIARRVFGGAHPLTVDIEDELEEARDALCARLP